MEEPDIASPLRSADLVGRDAEQSALRAAWRRAGTVRVVRGPAGIGKSALVRELSAWARSAGGTVMVGRCSAAARDTPLRAIREALLGAARGGLQPDESLASFLPALSRVVPEWGGRDSPAAPEAALFLGEGVLRVLACAGTAGASSALVIEDLQWADAETLAVVEYLADNVAGHPVILVATLRDGVQGPGAELVSTLVGRRGAVEIALGALSRQQVLAVARSCLGDGLVPAGAVDSLVERSEGIPYLVEELLASVVPLGWGSLAAAVPGSVLASVEARLTALPPEARALLVTAAVLGRQFDWIVAAAGSDLSQVRAAELLRLAVLAQLVDVEGPGFRFHHALTRDAVLASSGPAERRVTAGRALAALQSADPDLAGEHCQLAAVVAEHAGQPGQSERAAALGARLLGARSDPSELADLHLLVGSAELSAGRWEQADVHAAAARSLVPTDFARLARAASLGAQAAMGRDDVSVAVALADDALHRARAVACTRSNARLSRSSGGPSAGATSPQPGPRSPRRSTSRRRAVWSCGGVRALQELGTIDLFGDLALGRLEEARLLAAELGALSSAAVIDLQLAAVHDERGELERALVSARSCEEASRRWKLSTLPMSLLVQAMAHARAGRRE